MQCLHHQLAAEQGLLPLQLQQVQMLALPADGAAAVVSAAPVHALPAAYACAHAFAAAACLL
jgi:hypothetical protein